LSYYDKKEVFLLGFYYGFGLEMATATLLDIWLGNTVDAYIDFFFLILTGISFIAYRKHRNQTYAIRDLVIIATLTTYALFISSGYHTSVFFTIVPLGYFLLFSLKRSLVYTAIHYTIIIAIYLYGRHTQPDNLYLHDPFILESTFMGAMMIIIFGIVYHIAIENSYRKLAASDHQKELLLKEVHHRVKNNLNIISSMLGLQILREDNPRIKEMLGKNKSRIKSIALVHEILYKHDDFEKINIREYFSQLSGALLEIYDREVNVTIKTDRDYLLPFDLVLRLGIITNELIVNSLKHAFDKTERTITMQFNAEKEHYIYAYHDSSTEAVELEESYTRKGLGLRLIRMMVKQLDATMTLQSSSGLYFTFWIPRHAH